ncbi:hypothetical protein BJQ92_00763 [Bacillus licheniformis]|uniref:hypothetical protein n=1 Tax=Bacillus licheniformis TaxID=1402 RepID=UPI0021E09726|nr:hypothetical protein [Bacillus licheniformis]
MTKTNEKIHVLADESLGGIKREYVEVNRKAKLGEKIVIVDADPGYGDHYSNGDFFTVELYTGYGSGVATKCGHHVGKTNTVHSNRPTSSTLTGALRNGRTQGGSMREGYSSE